MSRTAYPPQLKVINIKNNAVCVVLRTFIPCTLLWQVLSVNPFLQICNNFSVFGIDKFLGLQNELVAKQCCEHCAYFIRFEWLVAQCIYAGLLNVGHMHAIRCFRRHHYDWDM